MTADEVIARTAELCRKYHAREVVLFGSRAKGTALERSDPYFVYSRSSGYGYMREWIIVGGHQAVWTKNLEEYYQRIIRDYIDKLYEFRDWTYRRVLAENQEGEDR